jgi:hypothetical protein
MTLLIAYGKMADVTVAHDATGFLDISFGSATDHIDCHHILNSNGSRLALFGDDPAEHIALGEDPRNGFVILDDQCSHLVIIHYPRGVENAGSWKDAQDFGALVGQDVHYGWHTNSFLKPARVGQRDDEAK